jgi:hypothetical protein
MNELIAYVIAVVVFFICSLLFIGYHKRQKLRDSFNIRDDERNKYITVTDIIRSLFVSATIFIPVFIIICSIICGIAMLLCAAWVSLSNIKLFRIGK